MTKHQGFTLIELAIVLTIIGLIVGGIISGQSLIRAAELNNVVGDIEKYTTAVNVFKDKYGELPGDMSNAKKMWPSMSCTDTTTSDGNPGGCNGDGDGKHNSYAEAFRAWQHMGLAGVIDKTYSGINNGHSHFHATIGVTLPETGIKNAGFMFYELEKIAPGHPYWFPNNYGKTFMIGESLNGYPSDPFISVAEAKNIDKKIDDGSPSKGKLYTWANTFHTNCTISATAYATGEVEKACALIYSWSK